MMRMTLADCSVQGKARMQRTLQQPGMFLEDVRQVRAADLLLTFQEDLHSSQAGHVQHECCHVWRHTQAHTLTFSGRLPADFRYASNDCTHELHVIYLRKPAMLALSQQQRSTGSWPQCPNVQG